MVVVVTVFFLLVSRVCVFLGYHSRLVLFFLSLCHAQME